jgi:methionyl-tRNA synthetase
MEDTMKEAIEQIIRLCREITDACGEDADWESEVERRQLDHETATVILTLLNAAVCGDQYMRTLLPALLEAPMRH